MIRDGAPGQMAAGDARATQADAGVVDCDVHHDVGAFPNDLGPYLSGRTLRYLSAVGLRSSGEGAQILAHRDAGGVIARLDAIPEDGVPGSDPDLAREQLLDEYGISAAVLNGFVGLGRVVGNIPSQVTAELTRAFNDWTLDRWLAHDPRWRASICVPYEDPGAAAQEIARCRSASDRFVQVLLPSRSMRPIGNPIYWPIYDAAAESGIPVGFHSGFSRLSQPTACGMPSYYFESHVDFALQAYTVVTSLIFEGVFDRWPTLAVVLAELGWTWVAPLAWRMDSTWRVLRDEVEHLHQKPSQYLADHFWFTTQPMVQPTEDAWLGEAFEQFDRQFGAHLMFSSDYPHWDFDAPDDLLLASVPPEQRKQVLGATAAKLYRLDMGSSPNATTVSHV